MAFSPRVRDLLRGNVAALDALTADDLYGLPQQGVNEKGLFFGGAQTEAVEPPSRPGVPKYDGAIVDLILRRCGTVAEALKMLDAYDYVMPAGHLLFGDRSGDSFILEAGHVIVGKTGRHQVITNFLGSREPDRKSSDRRYTLANGRLKQESRLSNELAASILKSATQSSTQYSLVFDLSRGTVLVYRDRRFDQSVELNVRTELAKGPHAMRIRDLFSSVGQ